jgi:hypothetical protein
MSLIIGNGCGFWGDDPTAPEKLAPYCDVLTLDYLSELSLSILAAQREKNPNLGYAKDCLDVIASLIPHWKKKKFLLVTNGGGFNPLGLAQKAKELLGDFPLKVAIVTGDDVLPFMKEGRPLFTAHAYLGAEPIAEAIRQGADLVITGRVADPSLTLGPLIAHFGWTSFDLLAQGTLAGHLIECGTQVTGGLREDWTTLPDLPLIGYPLVEVFSDGKFIITKPIGTGGKVDRLSVALQMVYEIGDPSQYLSPDVTANFLPVQLREVGPDRVEVTGAKGSPPPKTLKVSGTYRAGFFAQGQLALYGGDVKAKGEKIAETLLKKLKREGYTFDKVDVSLTGFGGIGPLTEDPKNLRETILRIAVRGDNKKGLEAFCRSFAPFVTGGPTGVTGYTNPRGDIRPLFGFCPCFIEREKVHPEVKWI